VETGAVNATTTWRVAMPSKRLNTILLDLAATV
jgi:hypothetical protein